MCADIIRLENSTIRRLIVGPLEVNCYLFWDNSSKKGVVIDPGGDADVILEALEAEGLSVGHILNTHGHFDHVGAVSDLHDSLKVPVALHSADVLLLENASIQAEQFGLKTSDQPTPTMQLTDGMDIEVGGTLLKAVHTPGHTEGGVSFYCEDERVVFTGDTLFHGSIGRTDLPGGSYEQIIESIKGKLLSLGDDVLVFPGHGSDSTIAEERKINPFIK